MEPRPYGGVLQPTFQRRRGHTPRSGREAFPRSAMQKYVVMFRDTDTKISLFPIYDREERKISIKALFLSGVRGDFLLASTKESPPAVRIQPTYKQTPPSGTSRTPSPTGQEQRKRPRCRRHIIKSRETVLTNAQSAYIILELKQSRTVSAVLTRPQLRAPRSTVIFQAGLCP